MPLREQGVRRTSGANEHLKYQRWKKKKVLSLLQVINNLCDSIRDHSQQQPLPAPQGEQHLYENAVDAVQTAINANLERLLEEHNLNLPPNWTFPELTTEVIGGTTEIDHLFSILKDLCLFGTGSNWFHQALNLLASISGGVS